MLGSSKEDASVPSITFGASSNRTASQTEKVSSFGRVPVEKLFMNEPGTVLQSSVVEGCEGTEIIGAGWGLCSTIVDAYNTHHELVLKPDNVWQAIMTQFGYYVSANAEALRDRFVDFQGKKELLVDMGDVSIHTCNYAELAQRMVDENIVKNIKDPSVVDWLLPAFSTTTVHDRVVAAMSIMATLQKYFEYRGRGLCCGIPKVTLLGTVQDWQMLRLKIDKLLDYDLQSGHMSSWHKLLVPVLDNFVSAASGDADVKFWDFVCSHHGGGSGQPRYLSGWVTVFAVFRQDGTWQGSVHEGSWPRIMTNAMPSGSFSVPLVFDDHGVVYATQMRAGQLASQVCSAGHGLCPRSDWCISCTAPPGSPVASK